VLTAVSIVFLAPAGSATYRIEWARSTTPGEPQVGPGDGPPPSAPAPVTQPVPTIVATTSTIFIAPPSADTGSTPEARDEVPQVVEAR